MSKHQVNLFSLKIRELTNLSYFLLKDESYRNDEYFIWPLGLNIYKLHIYKLVLTNLNEQYSGSAAVGQMSPNQTFSMEKMEKPLSNSPSMPFYAMNFDHQITYVAAYLETLTI